MQTMEDIGYGLANGKIILMGEHSVVYGKPAIALPFDKVQIESRIYKSEGPITIDCLYYKGALEEASDVIEGIRQLIQFVLTYLNQPVNGLHIKIDSNLPAQRGLGSSAAVSVAVVRSIFDAFKVPLSDELLHYFVGIAEQIHHTNPSGLDATTISSNRAIFFQKEKGKSPIPMQMDAILVVADTGRVGQTKQAVDEVRQLWSDNPTIVNPILDRLGALTEEVRGFLKNNEVIRLGLAMTEAHTLLKKINVSDEGLEFLVETALKNGALGAKLTGGGKGGCMIALTKSKEEAIHISKALLNAGAHHTWFYDLGEIIDEGNR
jgi:mevalonate kinase